MNKILVIIPIYNREKYLKKAIDSVLNQTHKNFELVLVDDASTDKSLEICKQYENLDNVTLLSNSKNMGCYYTRNHALYHFKDSKWDFFTIHDSDDTSSTDRFQKILLPFSDQNLLGLKTTYMSVDTKGKPHRTKENPNTDDIYASEGIAIFTRNVFDILGYYDDTRFSGDTEYWTRLQMTCSSPSNNYICGAHKQALYRRLIHDQNLVKKYDFHTVRPEYFNKFQNDIMNNLVPSGSLHRNFSLNE
jgi:glycosyltransferase involved in cell wall biosynthesis|tara:strand:- start:133 stop:873 length:741 start_codon:yes stop_codon:yes gene_type:complete